MALNNCDITSVTFEESDGSNLSGRSASERTLVITPQAGYVVDKDDFTIPNPLPTGVDSIVLSDTTFPGEPENNVNVLVNIASSYSAGTTNNVISLGLTGGAKLNVSPVEGADTVFGSAYVHLDVPAVSGFAVSETLTTGVTKDGNNLQALKSNKAVTKGVSTTLIKYDIAASNGNRFLKAPSLELINNSLQNKEDGKVSLTVVPTKDASKNIIKYTVSLNYISKVDTIKTDELKYRLDYKTSAIPTSTTEIKKVDFGLKDISKNGGTRRIRVYGDAGSNFVLTVRETGQSPFFGPTTFQIEAVGKYAGTLKGIHFKDVNVNIPAKATSTTYDVSVATGISTAFNNNTFGISSGTKTFVINQFANPTITISTIVPGGAQYSAPANIVKTGRPNKDIGEIRFIKGIESYFDFNYSITTSASSISIDKVPEFKLVERHGTVASNDLDRIVFAEAGTSGLVVGMKVLEHSDDTSLPARTITSVSSNHIQVSSDITSHGENKAFTFIKSDWSEAALVPFLNGGTRISIRGLSATANGQTATISGRVFISRYGNASITPQLTLNNILTES